EPRTPDHRQRARGDPGGAPDQGSARLGGADSRPHRLLCGLLCVGSAAGRRLSGGGGRFVSSIGVSEDPRAGTTNRWRAIAASARPGGRAHRLGRFGIVGLTGIAVNEAAIALLVSGLHLRYLVG